MIWIILGVVVLIVAVLVGIYNSLVKANVRVDEAWSDITVQLKRRADLIPNLINTVKGYAKHETSVFEKVTEARASTVNANTPKEATKAENVFQEALKSIFAVAEAYPDLKADQNFKHLQEELVDTEDKIQASRRFYNGSARDLNTKIKIFPNNLFAGMLGFKAREFFELEDAENEAVQKPVEAKFE